MSPSPAVRNLGIDIYADLSAKTRIQRMVASSFAELRQLHAVRWSMPPSVLQTLPVSLVLSGLDHGNATLIRTRATMLHRLQSVLNTAARSIAGLPPLVNICSFPAMLQKLQVTERIKFQLAVLTERYIRIVTKNEHCRFFNDERCERYSSQSAWSGRCF
jgi:hypothetical protein